MRHITATFVVSGWMVTVAVKPTATEAKGFLYVKYSRQFLGVAVIAKILTNCLSWVLKIKKIKSLKRKIKLKTKSIKFKKPTNKESFLKIAQLSILEIFITEHVINR